MFDMSRCITLLEGCGDTSVLSSQKRQLHCISNLPDLEITPISPNITNDFYSGRCNEMYPNVVYCDQKLKYTKEEKNMLRLLKQIPVLNENYNLHKKIGEGTYSTVYLASFKNSKSRNQFAVKHLTDNFSLSRIRKELRFMKILGGHDNVVNVLNCFQNEKKDCVVFVMPYLQHKRFSDYVLSMDASELSLYMKNLFIALRRVHRFNVIHRDVKPGNFLYNRETKEFLLVDFGLAQDVNEAPKEKSVNFEGDGENMPINYSKRKRSSTDNGNPIAKSVAISPLKSRENLMSHLPERRPIQLPSPGHGANNFVENKPPLGIATPQLRTPTSTSLLSSNRKQLCISMESPHTSSSFANVCRETSLGTSLLKSQTESKLATTPKNSLSAKQIQKSFTPLVASEVPTGSFVQVRNSQVVPLAKAGCACAGVGVICTPCAGKRAMAAPRAGTPGFRPPEVLLKFLHQTTAVDMWAAGVVMLCVLSGCYPFFKSPSDLAALAEIITIFGTAAVEEISTKFGRKVSCSGVRNPLDLKKMCRRLRARKTNQNQPPPKGKCLNCQQSIRENGCVCKDEALSASNKWTDGDIFPDSAYHLLSRLLDLDPETRITAAEALEHPFITQL